MNREPIRSPARSVANVEFHHTGEHVNAVAHRIVAVLEAHGVRATNPAMGFPMEMDRWSVGQTWVVSHKPVAVAAGLEATYHFTFTGDEPLSATVVIRNQTVQAQHGHIGTADLHVMADSRTWLGFVAKERSLVWALVRRTIRLKGSPRLLLAFGKCFPS
jgi:hypothetical protein